MFSAGCLMPRQEEKKRKQQRKASLKFAYHTTPERIEEMKLRQRGLCAICSTPLDGDSMRGKPVIDHKVESGVIILRGIVHNHCNLIIGHAFENPAVLRAAASYLENYL
jgi:hypothetical protein